MCVNTDINILRSNLKLPESAEFLGWLIYNEDKDDFLQSYSLGDHFIRKAWILSPEGAKKFSTVKKANSVLNKIEVLNCKVVASFDIGSQILVSD